MGEAMLVGLGMTAKAQYFSAFSPVNNFGMIAPLFVAIIVCKDSSYGTVRNKIISGHSRTSIYLSSFVSSALVISVMMLAHALLTLGIALMFFEYQSTAFVFSDFLYFLLSTLFEMLVCIFIAAIVSFLAASMPNVGLTIVCFFAIEFLFLIIGSVTSIAVQISDPTDELAYHIVKFLDKANVFTSTAIGMGTTYEPVDVAAILLPTVLGTALITFLGNLVFHKKDLK